MVTIIWLTAYSPSLLQGDLLSYVPTLLNILAFQPVTQDDVAMVVFSLPNKHFASDPIPTWLS